MTMRALAIVAAMSTVASGCGPLLYYGLPRTQTYDYERRVPITVDSDPVGATILASDGTALGSGPLVVEERVRVRRRQRTHDPGRAMIGCVIDFAIFVPATLLWDDRGRFSGDAIGNGAFAIGGTALFGCLGLAILKLANLGVAPTHRAMQAPPVFSSAVRTDEQVVSRSIELVARWDKLGEARAKLEIPAQRAVTLRFARRYTFEEAKLLLQRAAEPSPAKAPAPEKAAP
jgi:hypothetical protein